MWRTAGFNTWSTPLSDYINDLCNVSKVLEFILFADDTNIFFPHNDPNFLLELVNTELKKLSCWFQASKLAINVKKSNYIIFKTSQNRQKLDLHFSVNDTKIDRVAETLFFGVIILMNAKLGNLIY